MTMGNSEQKKITEKVTTVSIITKGSRKRVGKATEKEKNDQLLYERAWKGEESK